MTTSEEWAQVEALFDAAWEHPEHARRAWLTAQPLSGQQLAAVLRLLDAAEASNGFLEPAAGAPPQAPELLLSAGDSAGHWRVVRAIGSGGMGEVHEVERDDGQFRQRAALKVMTHADASAWQRFQAERQILAGLDHPGIARMIDGGLLDRGQPYMVMEYVDGEAIDAYCERCDADLRLRVALVIQVCAALEQAHGQLVVHRDLKPSNVLVDRHGRARLIDFGIARLTSEPFLHAGDTVLSLDFAAPEQAAGGEVLTATDVYGLGAVLYRLVAGCAPRDCKGQAESIALARVRSEHPLPLARQPGAKRWSSSGAQRSLLADLDAIAARALQPRPGDRYRTAESLGNDLGAALRRDVVQARLQQRGHRWWRQAWRQRWSLLVATAILASLAIGLVVALWQAREAASQRDRALREQSRLEAVQYSLFHMFRSAGELRGSGATAADVLGNAAQRIEDEFARDPARGAPVLHALGELYFLITDYEAARPLLQRLADADPAIVDPAMVAAGRYDLAQVLSREGDVVAARQRLAQAQGFWNLDRQRWQSRLVDSRLLESQLLRQDGHDDDAIRLLEDGLRDRIRLSGVDHRETGIFHNNLGVALFGMGRVDQAREAFVAARAVWQAAQLEQTPDALNTLNNWGSLELADGRPEAAMPLLHAAVDLRRRYFGASAATAALLSNYGKLLLQTGQVTAALAILREAAPMGAQFAGAGSLHHVAAASGVVEAELAIGERASADQTATAALAAARATSGADGASTAIASLAMARVREEQGRRGEARILLEAAERVASRVGGGSGARLSAQVAAIRARYPAGWTPPTAGTARPLP